MRNKKINIKTIIIIVLIGIIISLSFIILNTKNKNIIGQEIIKEQLGGTTTENTYVKMQTHLSEVNDKEQKLVSFKSSIASAITEMGVQTSENADANTMASNIKNINFSSGDFYVGLISWSYAGTYQIQSVVPEDYFETSSTGNQGRESVLTVKKAITIKDVYISSNNNSLNVTINGTKYTGSTEEINQVLSVGDIINVSMSPYSTAYMGVLVLKL